MVMDTSSRSPSESRSSLVDHIRAECLRLAAESGLPWDSWDDPLDRLNAMRFTVWVRERVKQVATVAGMENL